MKQQPALRIFDVIENLIKILYCLIAGYKLIEVCGEFFALTTTVLSSII